MDNFNTPHDWFVQFMIGGVMAAMDQDVTDSSQIVTMYCEPLSKRELVKLERGISDVLVQTPFPFDEIKTYRYFSNPDDARSWLHVIHRLVTGQLQRKKTNS